LSYDPAAAERVRQLLSGRSDVIEKKMVGGLSFLVNGNMCCGITGMALMVRVGAESREQALGEPHVRPMLFAGRALSGFVCIDPAGYAADDALDNWVQRGLDFVSGLPAKPVPREQLTRSAPPGRQDNLGPRPTQQELRGRSLHSERQMRKFTLSAAMYKYTTRLTVHSGHSGTGESGQRREDPRLPRADPPDLGCRRRSHAAAEALDDRYLK
jgi:TfoX/Sxy family transcriptional regulator of competence genes